MRKILVTGATGKVGRVFVDALLARPQFDDVLIRALCHNRTLPAHPRVETVHGSIADEGAVQQAMQGVTHVLHLATCKETPQEIMDVAVKGLFWLLESARQSHDFQQFILIGGDAGMGHFVYPQPIPVTETQKWSAYPGCYALSKVLEEAMLEQYYIQYQLNGCCLRAPWIMDKDDFKYTLTFGEDVFGGPRWHEWVTAEQARAYAAVQTVPLMLDAAGQPVQRNFVHVDDLVESILCTIDHPKARQQTFNICMDEPVNYQQVADYLRESRGLAAVPMTTPFHATWLDNTKAKFLLGWRPKVDLKTLIDRAWDYRRSADDPRIVWYPG